MKPFLFILCLCLTACKVGPNYHPPVVEVPCEFSEVSPDQTVEVEDEDLVHWWSIFQDPFLDELLDRAMSHNFNYRIALEGVFQARAIYWMQFTQLLPEFDATLGASRFRTSQSFGPSVDAASATTAISPIQNFFLTGLDAIWEIDLFGKLRRSAAAAYDQWEASAEQLRGVKLTVISEVANTYSVICAYQQKKHIASDIVRLDEEFVGLAQSRVNAGLSDMIELEQAKAVLEADKAQLDLLESALKDTIYSMSILLGMLPEETIALFQTQRTIPQAEGLIPVGLPSDLLRRRPDIRASERQLAAATEQIGVAVASLFPSLSLTGSSSSFAANPLQGANVGFTSDTLSKLFRHQSLIWGIGGLATTPVFDFGKRSAAVGEQMAIRNQAYYAYQQTVIAAFQETEQVLQRYFNEEKRQASLVKESEAYGKILNLSKDRFQSGLDNYTQVLQAKAVWLASLNTLTDSQQALTSDLIAIYKALGGDW